MRPRAARRFQQEVQGKVVDGVMSGMKSRKAGSMLDMIRKKRRAKRHGTLTKASRTMARARKARTCAPAEQ